MKKLLLLSFIVVMAASALLAQRGGRRGIRSYSDEPSSRLARDYGSTNPEGLPEAWTNAMGFEKDVWTFARVYYGSGGSGWRGRGGGWDTDLADSDINLSFRLQQVTSMKVDPNGRIVKLTDPDLSRYPFLYVVEPGDIYLDDGEIVALRKHLLNGGFVWFDDFWGDSAWNRVEATMKQVFPDRNFIELALDHPMYRCVFDIKAKHQVPNMRTGHDSQITHVTWETQHDGDVQTVHHKAIYDDKGRMMVLATHNTDNGDGWEREGYSEYYFKEFSEKAAYPLAINVIYYVMTH